MELNDIKYIMEYGVKLRECIGDCQECLNDRTLPYFKLTGNKDLHRAVDHKNTKYLKLLLVSGVNVNIKNYSGETPLHMTKDVEHANLLLAAGADPNMKTKVFLYTPLHRAAAGNYAEVIWSLLKYGAEINSQNCYGCTPLHNASYCGHIDCVQTLLENNADFDILNKNGETAKDIAQKNGHKNIVHAIENQSFKFKNIKRA